MSALILMAQLKFDRLTMLDKALDEGAGPIADMKNTGQ
jgi:hypothetical protein